MLKTYIANTDVAFTVSVGNKRKRVSFISKSGNEGSVYFTSDPKLQEGIEKHPWYGDKVTLREAVDEKALAEEGEKKKTAHDDDDDDKPLVHHVDSPNEAKDYLAEKFGISRTKMKTLSAILAVAKECGVTLEGLDNDD